MLPIAILAGGLATRLHPITETIPKALIDIEGKPFIFRQLEYLSSQGINRVVICIGHFGEVIQNLVGDGSRFGLKISYSLDGTKLLGTGGALKRALPLLGDEFFVLYGDSFLPIDYALVEDAFFSRQQPSLMTVLKNNDNWDKSNVVFRDGEILEYNKSSPRSEMAYIDYGLGVMSSKVMSKYPANKAFDLAEIYYELSLKQQLAGYEVFERFYEIGSHTGIEQTKLYFLNKGQ